MHAVLDAAAICHLGFVVDGRPVVLPTIHARVGDVLYLHGSPASGTARALRRGIPVCVTATVLDGLVLARSAFHHSMNFRSVVVHGTSREVEDPRERSCALEAIVEHVLPGRWAEVRHPSEWEDRATAVLSVALEEASVKVRTGPPGDEGPDAGLPVWAGVVPLRLAPGEPEPAPDLHPGVALPGSVRRLLGE